jgi:hypothetical protein
MTIRAFPASAAIIYPGKSFALLSTTWSFDAFRLNVASHEAVYSDRRGDSGERNKAKMHDHSNDGRRLARSSIEYSVFCVAAKSTTLSFTARRVTDEYRCDLKASCVHPATGELAWP